MATSSFDLDTTCDTLGWWQAERIHSLERDLEPAREAADNSEALAQTLEARDRYAAFREGLK